MKISSVTVAEQLLTLWVEKYLHLEQGAGEQLKNILYPQQIKHLTDGKVKEWQLRCARPLAHHRPIDTWEFEGTPGGWQGHLIEDVVDIALQWEGRGLGGRDGLVKLLQHLPAGLREGHWCYQADALWHVQRVTTDVIRVEALQAGNGRCCMEHRTRLGVLVSQVLESRWRGGSVQDVVLLCVVHVVKGLHGTADLLTGHLLKEGEGKAVSPRAVLSGDDEGVELRLPRINLCPERQTLWHTELWEDRHQTTSGRGSFISYNRASFLSFIPCYYYWSKNELLWLYSNHTMPTASWSNGFHSTLSGKCARTLDLKVLRNGLCSKFSPESEAKREKSKKQI